MTEYPVFMRRSFPNSFDRRNAGFTMIELLIVIAIIGIILTIGVFNGRQALTSQQERAAVNSLRQASWQGATAAAARGSPVLMTRENSELLLRVGNADGNVIRREELPAGLNTNLPEGVVLIFTPPGKIRPDFVPAPGEYWVEADGRRLELEFSVIGEVEAR